MAARHIGLHLGPPHPFKGMVCLVTGGAQGIGLALALALARRGARVHAADHSPQNIQVAGARLAAEGLEQVVTLHQVDVTDHGALERCITEVHAHEGRLDVLVNNAAFTRWTDVAEMTLADAQLTMRTGYDAMVHAVKITLPLMSAAGGGHIVTMGSAAGVVFVKGPSAAYAAAKAAINAYTQILALELAGTPVHVTLVRPGTVVGTQFFGQHVPSPRMPRLADFLPVSSPEQVADAVVQGILHHRTVVDFPAYLPTLYRAYALAPRLLTTLARLGGPARRDYAQPRPTGTRPRTPAPADSPSASPRTLALRLMNKIAPSAPVSTALRLFSVPADTWLQQRTRGRWSMGRSLGVPTLLLTSTGSRTGQPRQTPLFYVSHRGGYAVVGSNFGLPHHPAWSTNLLHRPRALVLTAGHHIPVTARLVEAEEHDEIWAKILDLATGYQTYSDRSGRRLRIFHLEPDLPNTPHPR
ncbi:SDR family NAD(P)-dependent oxidoreductase [Streptomyces wedmorensis]